METFFINTKNSKTNQPHMFKYKLINYILKIRIKIWH